MANAELDGNCFEHSEQANRASDPFVPTEGAGARAEAEEEAGAGAPLDAVTPLLDCLLLLPLAAAEAAAAAAAAAAATAEAAELAIEGEVVEIEEREDEEKEEDVLGAEERRGLEAVLARLVNETLAPISACCSFAFFPLPFFFSSFFVSGALAFFLPLLFATTSSYFAASA